MYTKAEIRKMRRLFAAGMPKTVIAEKCGCTVYTVSRHCEVGRAESERARDKRRDAKRDKEDMHRIIQNKAKKFVSVRKAARGKKARRHTTAQISAAAGALLETHPFCYLCGKPIVAMDKGSWHLDHCIPRSRNGDSTIDNMRLAHRNCNFIKGAQTVPELLTTEIEHLSFYGYRVIGPCSSAYNPYEAMANVAKELSKRFAKPCKKVRTNKTRAARKSPKSNARNSRGAQRHG